MIIGVLTKWVITPLVVEDQVYQTLELIEGTKGYEVWLEPPNEIYTKYYFFHVTNPDEILDGNTPNLTEVGPYVYKETRKKQNVIPLGDDELQYGQYIRYDFDLERTQSEGCLHPVTGLPCRKSDVLTVINAPLVGVLNIIESLPDFEIELLPGFTFTIKGFLYDLINQKVLTGDEYKDEVFHEYAVDDILWSGYNPGIMKYFFNILDTLEDTIHSSFNITLDLESYLPPQIQNGTLAYFRDKNATDANSFYKINRGRHDKGKYCMIEELNGKSELPDWWWPNIPVSPTAQRSGIKDTCHTLRGSDGVFFPPFIDKNYPLWLYVPDLCRSVFADYESETEIKGIKAWRFRANLDLINYARPENLCFCPAFRQCAIDSGTGYWDLSNCDKPCLDGTLHASGCLGVPVVLSAPHFYNADTSLEKAINGLKSNIDLHDTYLDVEPTSGITLSAHKRGQVRHSKNVHTFYLEKVLFFMLDQCSIESNHRKVWFGVSHSHFGQCT